MALGGGGSAGAAGAIRAGRAFVELTLDDKQFAAGLTRLRRGFAQVGHLFAGLGAGLATAGSSVMAPLAGLFKGAVDRGTTFSRMAAKLGDTTENLSAFAYAAETTGVSLEQLLDDFENWPERISEAARGTGEAVEAFKMLGLSAGELQRIKSLPLTQQIIELSEAMQGIPNETDRLMLLGKFFSDKGQNLNALFKMGPAGIRALMAQAGEVGAVVSKDQAEQAARSQQALNRAWAAGKNALLSFGAALLPLVGDLEKASAWAVSVAKSVRLFIEENKGAVQTALMVAAATVAAGLGFVALGVTLAAVGAAVGGVMTALVALKGVVLAVGGFLISPWGIALAAVAGLTVAFFTLTDAGKQLGGELADAIGGRLLQSLATFTEAWGGIKDALASGDLTLAAQIAFLGLQVEFRRVMLELTAAWNKFKDFFVDGWHDAMMLIRLAMNDASSWLAKSFVSAIEFIEKKLGGFLTEFFAVRAKALRAIGMEEMAAALDAAAEGVKGIADNADAIRSEIERDRSKKEDQIVKDADRAKAAGAQARAGDFAAAQAALQAAQDELDVQVGIAEENAMAAREKLPEGETERRGPSPLLPSGMTRGTFGVPDFAQFFGGGPLTVAQKTLDETKLSRKTLGSIDARLEDIHKAIEDSGPRFA